MLLAAVVWSSPAMGQAVPDASEVMRCFGGVREFVRAWGEREGAIQDPAGTTGASVTLRLGGRVFGHGSDFGTPGGRGRCVERAMREAWGKAMGEMVVDEDDERADERRRALAGRVTVDLEVAGEMWPLVGESYEVAASRLSPGVDGVAIRVGDRVEGVFPGLQLSTGLTPVRALRVAAGMLDLPPVALGQIRQGHEVTLYGFRTQEVVEVRPGDPAIFVQRGGSYVALSEVTGATLREAAAGIARHLATHEWGGQEPFGLTGNYEPTTGRYDPLIGGPRSQGLVAFALARYSRTPGIDAGLGGSSLELGVKVLEGLRVVGEDERDPLSDPVASATWLMGWAEVVDAGASLEDGPGLEAQARAALDTISFEDDRAAWDALAPGAKALIAYAMARAAHLDLGPGLEARAREVVRDLFRGTNSAQLASLMPWLGWAELELAGGGEVPSAVALREFRSLAWRFRIDLAPGASSDADLSGGIVFLRGGARLPTWQTLRPLPFLATMLGSRELTDDDELGVEVAELRRSLRFVLQLTVREAELHMMLSERRSLGGLRRALWDQTESLDANALGLVTLSEVLRALSVRAGGPHGGENP